MDTEKPHPGVTGSELSLTTGVSADKSPNGTQQEHCHKLVHHDDSNAPSMHMPQYPPSKIFPKTGSSKNKKQHPIGRDYIYTVVNGHQITV
jgi:hypothetical protein